MLRRIGLVELLLELSDQIVLRVHDVQVLVLVPVHFVLLVLTGAADVVEDLPQFVTLGWNISTLVLITWTQSSGDCLVWHKTGRINVNRVDSLTW